MKSFFIYGTAVLLSLLFRISDAQQDQGGFFEHISSSEGLSHIGVNSIYQDSKGFLWIGTYDGLNRYDGLSFRIFNHKPDDSTSLINNRVKTILESHDGILWIGTEEGLCSYDPLTEKFNSLQLEGFVNKGLHVAKLFEDSRQRLWVLSNNNNIYIIHKDRSSCRNIYYQNSRNGQTQFYDVDSDQSGNYYLASSAGLLIVDADLTLETNIHNENFRGHNYRSITIQNDSLVWLGFRKWYNSGPFNQV